jgi:DNA topoisomerase-3
MAQKKGYRGVLSVGRVQTPTLAIVVNRDIEIENFKTKDYYDILG